MELTGVSISKLSSGDEKEFEKLYYMYFPVFLAFAFDYVKSDDVAHDIVQEVFVKYWEKHENFNDIISLKVFIYRSVRNSCLNELGKARSGDEDISAIAGLSSGEFLKENIIDKEIALIIHQQIARLPERRRRILILSLEGKNNSEISEILNISVNTVKTHKQKAYSELRVWLRHVYTLAILFPVP